MAPLARYLEREGYAVLNLNYPSTTLPIEEIVEVIHPEIAAFAGNDPVHFVGYSMGGLVIRAYLKRHRPPQLGRVVMLGTPNHGSEVADFLKNWALYRHNYGPAGQQIGTDLAVPEGLFGAVDYPLGIIAGTRSFDPLCYYLLPRPHDGKVTVESTKLEGMSAHITLPVSHTWMPYDRKVQHLAATFLKQGCF